MDSAFRQALGEANKEIRRLDEALTQKTMLYEKGNRDEDAKV